ncbi:MAG: light-harvesting antenna LH1, alpha subunit [Proteobacteria bacterium]|jgi:light-harvesting complex 1 alpha chain|nr:light-harvesting antenna LH1, alpha subunit [Pseudomonadota bacterium]
MYKIWLILDPRRAMVAVLVFAFGMVLVNHFVQLSTHRYGSWLNEGATPAAQHAPLPAPAN